MLNQKIIETVSRIVKSPYKGSYILIRQFQREDVTGKDENGRTYLHYVAQQMKQENLEKLNDLIQVAMFFIQKGVDPLAQDEYGKTFDQYVDPAFTEQVRELIQESQVIFETNQIYKLIDLNNLSEIGEKLKRLGSKVLTNSYLGQKSPLEHIIDTSNLKVLKFLLDQDASLLKYQFKKKDNDTVLHLILKNKLVENDNSFRLQIITMMEEDKTLVDMENDKGETPLHIVCSNGLYDEAKILVECGADIDKQDKTGKTPLLYAIYSGNEELVRLLIDKGAKLNVSEEGNGLIPLLEAMKLGKEDLVEYMIAKGADISAVDKEGNTTLLLAINCKMGKLAIDLINRGLYINQANNKGTTPLLSAMYKREKDLALLLIDKGANVNVREGQTPLIYAIFFGDIDLVKSLLNHGADVNMANGGGATPMKLAMDLRNLEIMLLLNDYGVDMYGSIEKRALYASTTWELIDDLIRYECLKTRKHLESTKFASKNDIQRLKKLLIGSSIMMSKSDIKKKLEFLKILVIANKGMKQTKSKENEHNFTLIAKKIKTRDFKEDKEGNIILDEETILDTKKNIILDKRNNKPLNNVPIVWDAVNERGKTLLDLAVKAKNKEAIEFLSRKITLHKWKDIPLYKIISNGNIKLAMQLINYNRDIHEVDNIGNTTLHIAVSKGSQSLVKLLINKGANINQQNNNQDTPLHIALKRGNFKMVELLINEGANLNIPDRNGNSPLQLIIHQKNNNIIKLIIKRNDKLLQSADFASYKVVQESKRNLKRSKNKFAMWRATSRKEILQSLEESKNELDSRKLSENKENFIRIAKKIMQGKDIKDETGSIVWDAVDMAGNTLLHIAVRVGNVRAVEFLAGKIDSNIPNNKGWTPIFIASIKTARLKDENLTEEQVGNKKSDNKQIINILKKQGAKLKVKDLKGKTLSDYIKIFRKDVQKKLKVKDVKDKVAEEQITSYKFRKEELEEISDLLKNRKDETRGM